MLAYPVANVAGRRIARMGQGRWRIIDEDWGEATAMLLRRETVGVSGKTWPRE